MATVTVPLTQGKVALIDEEDLPLVSPFKWRAARLSTEFYAHAWDNTVRPRKLISMHRLITRFPTGDVDHKNRNTLDNRRCNLRPTTHSLNKANGPRYRKNQSGFKGVYFKDRKRPWTAQIKDGHKLRQIGVFSTKEEAARAYDTAALEIYGEFAYLNFPPT